MTRPIRIVTFNARGLADLNRRSMFIRLMRNLNIDIICFQETNLDPDVSRDYFANVLRLPSVWTRLVGIVALSSRVALVSHSILSTRVAVASLRIDDSVDISIASVYAPSNSQQRRIFFEGMAGWDLPHECIMAGDFNSYANPVLDYTPADPTNLHRRPEWNVLARELDRRNLVDAFRCINPCTHQPTHSTPNRPSTRIDYIFVPRTWINRCASPVTEVIPGSDHRALILDVVPRGAVELGPGRWQLPTMLLHEGIFHQRIEGLWESVLKAESEGVDRCHLWDEFKDHVKHEAKMLVKWLYSKRERLLQCWTQELKELEANPVRNEVWVARVAQLTDLISQEREKKAQQQLLASREQWIEKGERPTCYFYQIMAS